MRIIIVLVVLHVLLGTVLVDATLPEGVLADLWYSLFSSPGVCIFFS